MKMRLPDSIAIGILLNLLLLGGCGGGGKDSPGISVSAVITPAYNGVTTSSVDAVQNSCTIDNGATSQSEYFADHTATASITASLINPSNIISTMTAFIDSYTLTFTSNADSPAAPPIQPDTRAMTFSFIASNATQTAATNVSVELVDLIRKNQYSSVAGGALNNYTATYTFSGHTEHGEQFTVTSQTNFQIGNFNNCPDGFTPL
jgi:hypothetical protein